MCIFFIQCIAHIMVIQTLLFDNFDTIFCTGNHQIIEIQERERKFNLKEKKISKNWTWMA